MGYAEHRFKAHGSVRCMKMHRLILGEPPDATKPIIDHINCNGLDNRRVNLRWCTTAENAQHRLGPNRNSKSGVRGVSFERDTNRWRAAVKLNGTIVWRERFKTLEEAAEAVAATRARLMPFATT